MFFQTGFLNLTWGSVVMLLIGCTLLYLGIKHKFEPLLLVPIGFGVVLVNLPQGILLWSDVGDSPLLYLSRLGGAN